MPKVNLNQLKKSVFSIKNYVDSNMVIRKLPVHSTTETDKAIIYYVNVMDLLEGAQYATFINPNDERAQQYRIVYVCDDNTMTSIASLSSTSANIHIVKAIHYTNYSNVAYNNIKYKVDYTNHSTSSDVIITKTLISYLPTNNRIEYEPTYEYNPATKKYVDDKFYQTGLMEEVGTIPCSEMQNCNNGTSRYVSSINFDELFSGYEDHVFYGIYDSDKLIRIRYDSTYNRLVTNELATSGKEPIALGFDLGTHVMYPFNGGKSDVKAYTFTNDLVIKRVPVFDVNKAATKQYVDDSVAGLATEELVNNMQYYEYPIIHYDSNEYSKGYVDITELKPDIIYKTPKYLEIGLGAFSRICICCKNDDGTLLLLNNNENMLGFSHMEDSSLFIASKNDTSITALYKSINYDYYINLKKTDGIWTIRKFGSNIPYPGSEYEYTPDTDYSPSTKKYVDDVSDTLVKIDTNKYKLITCDDPLVITKSDITDLTDATITIDNLIGQFGNLTANEDGTWTYTLNTIMTDVETFTFKVNDIEQALVIVPYREMQYDDSNGGITYDDNWVIEENSKHYNGKSHFTNTNGAEASFNFKGTGISILGKCEPNSAKSVIYLKKVSYTSMDTKLDYEIYQSNYYTRKNLSYNTYGIEFSAITVSAENRYNNYIDSIIVYDTLGTDLNDSIRKLYYGLDSSTGILRTDKENARFMPTRLYHPATKKYVDDTAETLVKKDTNKYKLITCDDPLVIAKSDITDIADATIRISNLTGQFGNLVANADGTWTYTLNTIMTDVETFTFKVNNVEQKLVIVPYKEMTYDDKNAGITYEGNWYEDTNDNYYKKSSHYTKGTDNSLSKLSFIFTGTAVRFIGMTAKTLGTNNVRSQIFIVNSDESVEATPSYMSMSNNKITSTDDILYNTSIIYSNIDDILGYGKYKSVLTVGKGSSCYVDKIIVYNTIQKLNDSIESLYNQKEATPTVLRTDIPNERFEPKELYDPATKCYVDKAINNNKVNMCTDEEITSMLTEVLGADYSATE